MCKTLQFKEGTLFLSDDSHINVKLINLPTEICLLFSVPVNLTFIVTDGCFDDVSVTQRPSASRSSSATVAAFHLPFPESAAASRSKHRR